MYPWELGVRSENPLQVYSNRVEQSTEPNVSILKTLQIARTAARAHNMDITSERASYINVPLGVGCEI